MMIGRPLNPNQYDRLTSNVYNLTDLIFFRVELHSCMQSGLSYGSVVTTEKYIKLLEDY